MKFKRILLKLSGESLMGNKQHGIDDQRLSEYAEQIAEYFQGVCLLCCTQGEEKEHIIQDIALARQHFEYFSINLFCNNTTPLQRDNQLAEWFIQEIYPTIQHDPHIEILLNNTDLGVG